MSDDAIIDTCVNNTGTGTCFFLRCRYCTGTVRTGTGALPALDQTEWIVG